MQHRLVNLQSRRPLGLPAARPEAWIERNWLYLVLLLLGIWTLTPWLAPLFMHIGWTGAGQTVYAIYSLFCHQLPDRSWFFFGPQISYSMEEVAAVWPGSQSLWELRRFIGTPEMGWKLAWSDRMVSFYGGFFLFGLLYAALRARLRRGGWRLGWQWLLILLLPIAIDVFTHAVSDMQGFGAGFRETNAWLAFMTSNRWSTEFYAGNAWGSFNAIMRLTTGLLGSFALIFWIAARVDDAL